MHRKDRSGSNTTKQKPASVTEEQIAKLKSLQKEHASLVENRYPFITQPARTFVTFVSCYTAYLVGQYSLAYHYKQVMSNTSEDYSEFENLFNQYNAYIETWKNLPNINPYNNMAELFATVLAQAQIDGQANKIIYSALNLIYHCVEYTNNTELKTILSNLSETEFQDLYNSPEFIIKHLNITDNHLRQYHQDVNFRIDVRESELDETFYFATGLSAMALLSMQYLYINPRLKKCLLNKTHKITNTKIESFSDYKDTEEHIRLIEDMNLSLAASNRKRKNYTNITMFIILCLFCTGMPDSVVALFLFNLTLETIIDSFNLCTIAKEKYNSYKRNQLSNHLQQLKHSLEIITEHFRYNDLEMIEARTRELSSFILQTKGYRNFSNKIVCEIIKGVLFKSGIEYTSANNKTIEFKGDLKLSEQQAKEIHNEIEIKMEQMRKLRAFKKQMIEFIRLFDPNLTIKPSFNSKKGMHYKFIFTIPSEYQSLFTQDKLHSIFGDTQVKFLNATTLQISGSQMIALNKISDLITEKKKIDLQISSNAQMRDNPFTQDPPEGTNTHNPSGKEKDKKTDPHKNLTNNPHLLMATSRKNVQSQPSQTKNTNEKNKLIPINSSHCKPGRLFLLFKLNENDFPNRDTYSAFQKEARKATIVPSFTKQGLVYCDEYVRDSEGNMFRAQLKIKLLGGNFGNMRAYAEKQKGANGESIYVVKGFNTNSHK